MNKNKLIALAILVVLVFVPFQWAYVGFSVETQLMQVLSMAAVIIGAVYAVLLFNKKTPGSGDAH